MTTDEELGIRLFLKSRFRGYRDDLGIHDRLDDVVDSLGLFELVEFLEQEFDIHIPNEEFRPERFSTLDNIGVVIREFSKP